MAAREIVGGVLLGIGFACAIGAWLVHREQSKTLVARPPAAGDVGLVSVYAQEESGPVRLQPDRLRVVHRPQDLAFQLTAKGTGPRMVRIELEAAGRRAIMHEQKLDAPAEQEMIDYVLELGDEIPDDVRVVVAIEAPHSTGYESTYPLRLTGSAKAETPTRAR